MILILRNIIDSILIFLCKITKTDLVVLSYKQKGIFNPTSNQGEDNVLKKEIRKYLEKQPIIFDIGANIGDYPQKIMNEYPDARLFCFEPHPLNYKKLIQKINSKNKHCYNLALGKENGTAKIFDHDKDDGSQHASIFKNVITEIHNTEAIEHQIHVKRLVDFCNENAIQHIDFIKLDTEGSEFEILNSSRDFLDKISIIQFEFNEMNIYSRTFFRDFYNLLNPNFNLFRIMPDKLESINTYNTKLEFFKFQNFLAINKRLKG